MQVAVWLISAEKFSACLTERGKTVEIKNSNHEKQLEETKSESES